MATEALMKRIHQLQNTRGKELSGVQITAYFLRIRVQPLQARKNPLWMYSSEKDVDRLSKDLSVKDLERLIRRFSSLSKKHEVPSSCRVEPYSASHALPEVSVCPSSCLTIFVDSFLFSLYNHLCLAFALYRATKFFLLSPFLKVER